MLKNIDPLLSAEILYALRSMGHGDEVIIADANFPADSVAKHTSYGNVLRMDGCTSADAAHAVLSVVPLDTFIDDAAIRMEVVGEPATILPVQLEVQAEIDAAEGKSWPMGSLERFAFYERAKKAYCVIATSERRFYGCFAFTMGVVEPD